MDNLNQIRKDYPKYKDWSDNRLQAAIDKKQAAESKQQSMGWPSIGEDVSQSLQSSPQALLDMLSSIPGGAKNVAKYATTTNPVSTMANIGAGGVESAAGLLSSPQMLTRYLAQKFPAFGKRLQESTQGLGGSFNDPTFYESLMKAEKEKGLAPQSPEEASVRNAGGLLFGGKALTSLPNLLTRTGAMVGESAGRGGDPVHAAILSAIGEVTAKAPWSKVKNVPQATASAVKSIPEAAGKAASSTLETVADASSAIPGAGKFISPIVQPTAGALASYLKHISVPPEELAKRNLFDDIDPQDLSKMFERDAAAKRLNLDYATPSELSDSPFESVKQANVGRTSKGMKLLYKLGKGREGSEESAINKLLDLIHTNKLDPVKKAAYEQTMKNTVPNEFIEKHAQRPVIQKAMKAVENNTAYKQMLQEEYGSNPENVAKNSFMYWDMVKRVLDDMESKAGRKGGKTESSVYGNTRRSMVSDLDAIEPSYKTARNIAERGFTRQKLESVFDKKDKNFNNFDSFLKSKENYNEILKKLDAFPEAKQQLEDIKLFSGNMIPNNPTIRAAAALKRTGMSDARNALEAKKREFDEKYGQEHDVAAVKLMTNPDLMKILAEHLKKKGK